MTYKIHTKEELEQFILFNWKKVNHYIDEQSQSLPIPFYSSVDIRESKYKYAPVDTNIFPAGFNNLCLFDLNMASEKMKDYILKKTPQAKNIVIFPESHTKNTFYLDHLASLQNCLLKYFEHVYIATNDPSIFGDSDSIDLVSHSGHELKVLRFNNDFTLPNKVDFDLIVLNNDQSKKLDINWNDLGTPVVPSPLIGWYQRQKHQHFKFYSQVLEQFCAEFAVDPNLMQAKFNFEEEVDFSTKVGLDRIASKVSELQTDLGKDTKVFIKASQGTYGMGIHVVEGPEEVLTLNRKKRNKLDIGKNNLKFEQVIIQEGIETVLQHDGHPAEVSIYLVGGKSVGGFLRSNPLKDPNSNLNSKGMVYQKFCISEISEGHDHQTKEAVYSIIGRLASLACAHEIQLFS